MSRERVAVGGGLLKGLLQLSGQGGGLPPQPCRPPLPVVAFEPGELDAITVRGAHQHNLKHISVTIPRRKLVVITGVSGSGKSSLAFDTIYAEGQRRYVENLSPFIRRFLDAVERPKVDFIEGLSPAIAIEQKTLSRNPRSTVGTVTEVLDYLRLLFSRVGTPHCLACGTPIRPVGARSLVAQLAELPTGTPVALHAPTSAQTAGQPYGPLLLELTVETSTAWQQVLPLVQEAFERGGGRLVVVSESEWVAVSNERLCPRCGVASPYLSGQAFNPNTPLGMCSACNGLGTRPEVDPARLIHDPRLSVMNGALRWFGQLRKKSESTRRYLQGVAERYQVDLDEPWADLPADFRSHVTEATIPLINRGFSQTKSSKARQWYASFMSQQPCGVCLGTRLCPEGRVVRLGQRTFPDVVSLSLREVLLWAENLAYQLAPEELTIAGEALGEVSTRLQFAVRVGLHYLRLDRPAATLSGGEGQRIRLVSQLGSRLVGVLYVLDEPSVGLHSRDQHTLIQTLKTLRDHGNSVLVVEHDAEMMLAADWLIDLGPGAGVLGGEVMAEGTSAQVMANPASLTGRALAERFHRARPRARRAPDKGWLSVVGARLHNLKAITARFPLGLLTCVTGVSGSGKSSLVSGTLYPALQGALHHAVVTPGPHTAVEGLDQVDKVITITQEPIGRTPRSTPATYVGVFAEIRRLFATLPTAQGRGYDAAHFSFNVPGGRCETCQGHGQRKIEMHFLAAVWVPCKECQGTRFQEKMLAVRYRGAHIADVLDLDVGQALMLFQDQPLIKGKLTLLREVGLDYLKLGQSAMTLSGGEAQRIKLAKELSRTSTGRTVYLLDEPTTGLHFVDVERLLDVLHRLVEASNTVLIVEHNLDVVAAADWVLDLGPEGGSEGGLIVAEGPPEAVAAAEESITGRFLRPMLSATSLPR